MGWVEDRFKDQMAYGAGVPRLWNLVRDSVGLAVDEFNERTTGTPNMVDRTDCRAKGKYCTRIHKAFDNSAIELFLDEGTRSLKTSQDASDKMICGYRLTADRSEVEFTAESEGRFQPISVDDACQMALGDFLFTPFPKPFLAPSK